MAPKQPEHHQNNRSAAGSNRLGDLRAVEKASLDMVFLLGADNNVLDANAYACQQLKLSLRDIVGQSISRFIFLKHDLAARMHQSDNEDDWVLRRHDGATTPVELRINRLPQQTFVNDQRAHAVAIVRDISEQRAYEERILRLAHYDAVTELINRSLLEDRAEQALTRAKRHNNLMAFLFLDLDKFKEVNDQLGHQIGDRLLKAVGMRIQSVLRDNDTLGRLGGDEFLVLAEEISYTDDAMLIASKIINTISDDFGIEGHVIQISTSIGIAMYPEHGDSVFQLIHNADKAMYRAKELGRNNLAVYNPNVLPDRD